MVLHPVILAVIVLDLLALLFFVKAGWKALRLEVHYGSTTGFDRFYEKEAFSARAAFIFFASSTLLLVIGLTNFLPAAVPGAMCGSGVIQATHGQGGRALLFRFSAIALFYLWTMLGGLKPKTQDSPLNAKLLLLASPFLFLALWETLSAFYNLDTQRPVDCCTAVYDRISGGRGGAFRLSDSLLVWSFAVLTFLLLLCGAAGYVARPAKVGLFCGLAAIISIIWAPTSASSLIRVFSPYYYEVLHHHCPWCLFLPEQNFAGFPLFLFQGAAFIEGPVAYAVYRASRKDPEVQTAGLRKARRALLCMVVLAGCFTIMAVWPALSWRIRFGVWMG